MNRTSLHRFLAPMWSFVGTGDGLRFRNSRNGRFRRRLLRLLRLLFGGLSCRTAFHTHSGHPGTATATFRHLGGYRSLRHFRRSVRRIGRRHGYGLDLFKQFFLFEHYIPHSEGSANLAQLGETFSLEGTKILHKFRYSKF